MTALETGETLEPLARKVDSWWLSVLGGQTGKDHPVFGSRIRARLRGSMLDVTGTVGSENALQQLLSEAKRFAPGAGELRFRVKVAEGGGQRGVLEQTIIGFYANREQALYARRYLTQGSDIHLLSINLVAKQHPAGMRELAELGWSQQLESAFSKGSCALIVRVDEVDAFRAQELMQETRSLQTISLPPRRAKVFAQT